MGAISEKDRKARAETRMTSRHFKKLLSCPGAISRFTCPPPCACLPVSKVELDVQPDANVDDLLGDHEQHRHIFRLQATQEGEMGA